MEQHGTWNMEHGTWNMEHGTWNMEHGTWNMEHGIKRNLFFASLFTFVHDFAKGMSLSFIHCTHTPLHTTINMYIISIM
jgi:hypothetical protein